MKITCMGETPIHISLSHPWGEAPLFSNTIHPRDVVDITCRIPDEHLLVSLHAGLDTAGCGTKVMIHEKESINMLLNEMWNLTRSKEIRERIEKIQDII